MKQLPALLIAGVLAAPVLGAAHHSFRRGVRCREAGHRQGSGFRRWNDESAHLDLCGHEECRRPGRNNAVRRRKPEHAGATGLEQRHAQAGRSVTIEGFRAKNGSTTCNSRTVKTAAGKTLFAGSSLGQGNE